MGSFTCPNGCGGQYKYKGGLQAHLNYKCGREKQFRYRSIGLFVCPNGCGGQYKYKGGLQEHLMYSCGREKQFVCTDCSKAFHRKQNLKAHIVENRINLFVCPNNCGRSYKYKGGVQEHVRYECGREKQFKCTECPKAFHRKRDLRAHIIAVHKIIPDW
ncbi:gastrula zinc finger protein XlCGF7.1-like [Planococcus citri]|uniref:gastrula zinc finger protein XlCGF7.1-like n=1 Tax=Planococcus citri TaxID=170843 RepID=UPI0031F7C77A